MNTVESGAKFGASFIAGLFVGGLDDALATWIDPQIVGLEQREWKPSSVQTAFIEGGVGSIITVLIETSIAVGAIAYAAPRLNGPDQLAFSVGTLMMLKQTQGFAQMLLSTLLSNA